MKTKWVATLWLCLGGMALANDLTYYLPKSEWDTQVPLPTEMLGYEVGDWHVRPEQLNAYMQLLASKSARIKLETIGRSVEQRPLQQLLISSPDNLKRIDDIRKSRQDFSGNELIVWLGYSIHGNEASGSNAALLTAYYLAASKDPAVEKLLQNTVIVFHPSLNPDGLARFATWVNGYRGNVLVPDPINTEHREAWPSGRGNHYWFDLNRDWLLLQQVETQARIPQFQAWRPQVLADFHEMGTDSTYFFQPGVPSRQHPSTPAENVKLTDAIARFHAQAFDEKNALYYSKEGFDDFYYGKGSTYPDIQGGVGILFEQASARGHLQQSKNGPVSFSFAIRNQVVATLSTLKGANELRESLLNYQRQFYQQAAQEAALDSQRAIVIGDMSDPARVMALVNTLRSHDITVHQFNGDWSKDGQRYAQGAYVIPLQQRQYRLIRNLFESRTQFRDPVFYDISSWNMAMAFDVPFAEIPASQFQSQWVGEAVSKTVVNAGTVYGQSPLGYVMPWGDYFAPRALYFLQQNGIKTKVATKPFKWQTDSGVKEFARGSIVITLANQSMDGIALRKWLEQASARDGVDFYAIKTGYADAGIDLGSPSVKNIVTPKLLLLTGGGVDAVNAGEVWHLLDARMQMPVTLLPTGSFNEVNLNDYTHLLMVDGRYTIKDESLKKLELWLKAGGEIIALDGAAKWLAQQDFVKTRFATSIDSDTKRAAYALMEEKEAEKRIAGAIFNTSIDTSHPLAYGLSRPVLPVFRTHADVLPLLKSPYGNVAVYTDKPLLSGYASKENQQRIANTSAVAFEKIGDGSIVFSTANLNFRSAWYGSARVLMNAIFFADSVEKVGENLGAH
jgi:hypothetical protein